MGPCAPKAGHSLDGGSLKWPDHEQQWLQALEQRRGGDGATGKREGRRGKGYGGACVPCLGTAVEEEREPRLKQQRQRELRSASMADALWSSRAAQRAREEESRAAERRVRRRGPLGFHSRRTPGTRQGSHAARKLGNGGHVHGHAASFEAFYRARGGQWYGRRGESIWATSRLNLAMGPKRSLLTSVCSAFLIKGAKSFEQQISG